MEFCVDRVSCDLVEGWALALGGIEQVEVFVDGGRIGATQVNLPRPDVSGSRPDLPLEISERCGFRFVFSDWHFQNGIGKVKLRILPRGEPAVETPEMEVARIATESMAVAAIECERPNNPAALPGTVMAMLRALRGSSYYDRQWTDELAHEALTDLEFLVRHGSKSLPGIYSYLGYLKGLWAKFLLIRDHFPRPAETDPGGAAPHTIEEMITIAHHLYVLRRNGIIGHLLEFGCGNGLSTSCLSNACFELGLEMDAFDPSWSRYKAVDNFDHIHRNVTEFGQNGCVKYHKGPFAETLPKFTASPSCIWIGRNFGRSTSEVMTLLDRVPARSCLFSHECSEEHFAVNTINAVGRTADAIAAIIGAFQRTGRNITGRHLVSGTGAFWDKNVSWPVLATDMVLRLVRMA